MSGLPFQLALSSGGGWRTHTLATFAEIDDLWLFWTVWREAINADTLAEARFMHQGRAHRYARPHDFTEAQAREWAAECKSKDRAL